MFTKLPPALFVSSNLLSDIPAARIKICLHPQRSCIDCSRRLLVTVEAYHAASSFARVIDYLDSLMLCLSRSFPESITTEFEFRLPSILQYDLSRRTRCEKTQTTSCSDLKLLSDLTSGSGCGTLGSSVKRQIAQSVRRILGAGRLDVACCDVIKVRALFVCTCRNHQSRR